MTAATSTAAGELDAALRRSAARHARLCPRQVLGVRMGIHAARLLGLEPGDRRLYAIVETDGCFVDGVEAATGCSLGARTLGVEDVGKVAATFLDTRGGGAVRIVPHPEVRERAMDFAPEARSRYYAQLLGYQRMPAAMLLDVTRVRLRAPLAELVGRPGVRRCCDDCGEEVIDGREVSLGPRTLCRACAWGTYYERDRRDSGAGAEIASWLPTRRPSGGDPESS